MKRQIITANCLNTICWFSNSIVDWSDAGMQYFLNGETKKLARYNYAYKFDAAIISDDGQYTFIYTRLGTKGLLLKNGELLREINRTYYCANSYEYPAAFLTQNDTTFLVHCPIEYCRLDFENVETGEIVTDVPARKPSDFFHSRLEINISKTFLLSKGWVWHPLDITQAFNIADCLENPLLLDNTNLTPNIGVEVCTASFITDTKVLIGSSDEAIAEEIPNLPLEHISIWDITTNKVSEPVKVEGNFGNLFAINDNFAWDTFEYPKIIHIKTGKVVDKAQTINSGKQKSAMFYDVTKSPQIAFNNPTKQIAIKMKNKIIVLTPPYFVFNG